MTDIRIRIHGHLFQVKLAEIVDGVVRPRHLTYEWVSGSLDERRGRGVDVRERRDGWHAQVNSGFTGGSSKYHGPHPSPGDAVRDACKHHNLAWPPEVDRP